MNDPTGLLSKFSDWLLKKIGRSPSVLEIALSKEAKDILQATPNGTIYQLTTDQTGNFIRSGKENYYFESDHEKTQKYNEALNSLISNGLVVHQSGKLFKLTAKGHQITEKLK